MTVVELLVEDEVDVGLGPLIAGEAGVELVYVAVGIAEGDVYLSSEGSVLAGGVGPGNVAYVASEYCVFG